MTAPTQWLEVIRVRSASNCTLQAIEALQGVLEGGPDSAELVELRVYAHGQFQGDLAVHLLWQSGNGSSSPTPLGRLLAERMRGFGLVDHSVWKQVLT